MWATAGRSGSEAWTHTEADRRWRVRDMLKSSSPSDQTLGPQGDTVELQYNEHMPKGQIRTMMHMASNSGPVIRADRADANREIDCSTSHPE